MKNYINFGSSVSGNYELIEPVRILYNACRNHPDFKVLAIRSKCDTIEVDCCNDQVPSRNSVGIKNRERLALIYNKDNTYPYEVRALRKDFPVTLHQNHVPDGEPASLCIYFEPWTAIERTWTPQLFLQRILWWLKETAGDTLHREDQPLEQLYFKSPIELVLPVDFEEKLQKRNQTFQIYYSTKPKKDLIILRGDFFQQNQRDKHISEEIKFECIAISPSPVLHAPISKFPKTLGELNDQFVERGSEIYNALKEEIKRGISSDGIESPSGNMGTLLILNAKVKRDKDAIPEKKEIKGFFINGKTCANLGEACGVLSKIPDGRYYKVKIIGRNTDLIDSWKEIIIEPIEIVSPLNRQSAQILSKTDEKTSNFKGVLAGVGALGSALADIWSKEAWGQWTYIDDDYLKPHNIVRHIARDKNIGQRKTDTVSAYTSGNFHPGYINSNAIFGKANDFINCKIDSALKSSKLFIDATTTLEVPRDIAVSNFAVRAASVFITPSGKSSVLLLEDKDRTIRLDSLEAQYYRAMINSTWGKNHLSGHQGQIWVGTGCRNASMIIAQDLILLHAATLARQTRFLQSYFDAAIRIYEVVEDNGAMNSYDIPVHEVKNCRIGNWEIVWDEVIYNKIALLRRENLPNETGGLIVGFTDQKQNRIYIVDILEAPIDSESSPTSFIRGINGANVELNKIADKTANVVEYIGEWHSHPRNSSAIPSNYDLSLLKYLSDNLFKEGKPGLIVIAGEDELSICINGRG
ncbi:MAG: Mov34/MPN/PAD-1 family protein [Patescibacteria group bacterium]|nr:Mov34/MPN/PAD-1 family protein [Patescibacteria group bacterium]